MPASLLTVTPLTASGISHVFDNIPYGPTAWYDASKISGIASGTSLSAWTDISGNGNTVVNSLVTLQPVYVTNSQNGLPVVQFTVPTGAGVVGSTLSKAFTLVKPQTVFLVLSDNTIISGHPYIDGASGVRSMIIERAVISGPARLNNNNSLLSNPTNITINAWYTIRGIFNGSASTISSIGTSSAGSIGSLDPSGLVIGAFANSTTAAQVTFGEIIIYNRILTETECQQAEQYLKSKWSTL